MLLVVTEADTMQDDTSEGSFDRHERLPEPDANGGGDLALDNDREGPTRSAGDSEMRPTENDARTSDGVETFKRMESEAESRRSHQEGVMSEQTNGEGPAVDEGTESLSGRPQFQRTPGKAEGEDPDRPETKPQGTLQDQEENMDAEGHLVGPPPTEAG